MPLTHIVCSIVRWRSACVVSFSHFPSVWGGIISSALLYIGAIISMMRASYYFGCVVLSGIFFKPFPRQALAPRSAQSAVACGTKKHTSFFFSNGKQSIRRSCIILLDREAFGWVHRVRHSQVVAAHRRAPAEVWARRHQQSQPPCFAYVETIRGFALGC